MDRSLFSTSRLGFINCDRFYPDAGPRANYFVPVGQAPEVYVKIVCDSFNAIEPVTMKKLKAEMTRSGRRWQARSRTDSCPAALFRLLIGSAAPSELQADSQDVHQIEIPFKPRLAVCTAAEGFSYCGPSQHQAGFDQYGYVPVNQPLGPGE